MGRRRSCVYLAVSLIVFWTLGTYYLASFRVPPAKKPMPSVEERASVFWSRLAKVEDALHDQAAQNNKLLDLFKKRRSAADAPPASSVTPDGPIAVLVFACNRPLAIRNHLDQLLKLRPSESGFPVLVSQDCSHQATADVVRSYGSAVTLMHQPDNSDIVLPPKQKKFLGYYKIARHYKWALNQTFYKFGYKTVIITEDDLDLSSDFFEYFLATYPLLRLDPSLWCISAWNDNGKEDKIDKNPADLHRTDFFPGLGWMMRAELWDELHPSWPAAFWDDWMRKPEQRKGRACVRPEISRTAMSRHGKVGVSKGLFFEKHLKHIILNKEPVAFSQLDLSYLLKDNYDEPFVSRVYSSPSITQSELRSGRLDSGKPLPSSVRLTYDNKNTFKATAKAFGLMDDFRAGVPRTSYRGVVPFMFQRTRVYLAPPSDWAGYDPTWT